MSDLSPAVEFARQNSRRFLDELLDMLRIPSISTLPEHKADIERAARFVAEDLKRTGLENVEITPRMATRWSTPTGFTPKASRRFCATATTTYSPSIR